MKPKLSLVLSLNVMSIGLAATTAFGQTNSILVSDDRVTIDVVDPRPLSAALQVFANEYPVDITYEDIRFANDMDVVDLTLQVRKDLHLYDSPAAAPRVLAPQMSSFSVDVPFETNSPTPEQVSAAIEDIVRSYASSAFRGTYRVAASSGAVHVIPVASRDRSGVLVAHNAILDTRISIPRQELDGASMFSVICEAVSLAAGGVYDPFMLHDTPLKPRSIPDDILIRYVGVLEAEEEPARDVFMRVLKAADETSAWLLFATFDPTYENYWIGARALRRNTFDPSDQAEQGLRAQPYSGTSGFILGEEEVKDPPP